MGEFQGRKTFHPKRHLKLPEARKKGFLKRILSLPEKLPKLPYLSSSMSVPSIETGNSTTSAITMEDLQTLLKDEELTDDETELLQILSEQPTSVSADLLPQRSSLQPFAGPLNPIPFVPSASANLP